jgi:3'-phosphoadenosine 5'-phosphosulfate sulfotransferase (PAPS reductase)/FAD synthetase
VSLDFDTAPYCKTKTCTNQLTAQADAKKGICGLCAEDSKPPKTEDRVKNTKDIFVSFSGGKTSGYMAKLVKDKYQDSHNLHFVFMNTGQEHPKTYEFIERCDREFGLDLVWLEPVVRNGQKKGSTHRIVTAETAHRGLELFEAMIYKYGHPNVKYLHCTRELKTNPFNSYVRSLNLDSHLTAIGIRSDEADRMSVKYIEKKLFYPLVDWIVGKKEVEEFWSKQSFNLDIPHRLGNCMGCHKKSFKKLIENVRDPEIYNSIKQLEKMPSLKEPREMFRGNRKIDDVIRDFMKDDPDQEEMRLSSGCQESCEVFND